MSITLRQLRYFVSAAETGKLSAAASECNVSQSAVTIAIKTLEDQMGVPLFERTAHGVELNMPGQRLLVRAREILALVSDAMRLPEEDESLDEGQGVVRVAATDTVMGYFLVPHLARFRARFPRIEIEVIELDRPNIEAGLVDGSLDVAVMLVSNLQNKRSLACSVLFPSQRRLWLPQKHPLLAKASVSLSEIAQEPFIMLTVDEAEVTARSYWTKLDLEPRVVMRSANVEAVRTAVARGLGIAILSDMVFRPWSLEGERIETRDVSDHVPSMDIGMAWKLGASHSGAVRAFIDFLQASYARSAGPAL